MPFGVFFFLPFIQSVVLHYCLDFCFLNLLWIFNIMCGISRRQAHVPLLLLLLLIFSLLPNIYCARALWPCFDFNQTEFKHCLHGTFMPFYWVENLMIEERIYNNGWHHQRTGGKGTESARSERYSFELNKR